MRFSSSVCQSENSLSNLRSALEAMPVSFDKEMLRVNDVPLWLTPMAGSKSQWICQSCLVKNQHINSERVPASDTVCTKNEAEDTLLHLLETRKCAPSATYRTWEQRPCIRFKGVEYPCVFCSSLDSLYFREDFVAALFGTSNVRTHVRIYNSRKYLIKIRFAITGKTH